MKRFFLPTLLLLASVSAFAQDEQRVSKQTRIEKQSATVLGDRGLFTISSVETLNRGQYSFTAGWLNSDRTPKDLDINTFPASISFGLLSRLTVTATIETQKQIKASNLTQLGFNPQYPFVKTSSAKTSFNKGTGDSYFAGKYRIWRQADNVGGMALRGFVKFPTAKPEKGLGTGQTDGGLDFIFTSQLPWKFKAVLLHSTMGFVATRGSIHQTDMKPNPLTIKDEVRSGLGFAVPSSSTLQGIFEYTTTTFVGAGSPNPADAKVQNPSDVSAGVRYLMLDRGVTFNAGYRINTKFDLTFPNNRERSGLIFGISYTKPVAALRKNHYPVMALDADSIEVTAGGTATITATGYDEDNDALTYSWTATGGQIEGRTEKVMFRTTGLAPGKYTIHGTANDGHGGIATAQIEITVK